MNKVMLAATFLSVTLAYSAPSHAQFGGLMGGGGGATPEAVDQFLATALDAETLISDSAWYLSSAVLAKEKFQALLARKNAATKLQDPKEKAAELRSITADATAALANAVSDSNASKSLETADKEKKAKISTGVFNFVLGVLKDGDLVLQSSKLVSGVPSPAVATKVTQIKNVVSSIKNQMGNMQKAVTGMKKLGAAVGLKALPTKSSDKPMMTSGEG